MEESLSPINRFNIIALNSSNQLLSTYRIAKEANLSWSTVNTHCYKLMSLGIINRESERTHFGQKKVFWKLIKK